MLQMEYRPRIYYTEAQKALMWDRWQTGDSLETIARAFDRGHSSVQRILQESGGIRPPQRRRSRHGLTPSANARGYREVCSPVVRCVRLQRHWVGLHRPSAER